MFISAKVMQIHSLRVTLLFSVLRVVTSQCGSENTTSGRIMTIVNGKSAKGAILSQEKVADVMACSIACNADAECQSTNAINVSSGGIRCEKLKTKVGDGSMIEANDSSYISYPIEPVDCVEAKRADGYQSGVYEILLLNRTSRNVYCDQTTDGGGWIVVQRRKDGSVNFYRNWMSYKEGFGCLEGEFWLGLDKIHQLVKCGQKTLRIDLWDDTDHFYAIYKSFSISDESDGYRINWSSYEGNATDSLNNQRGMMFSTFDRDNDISTGSCAQTYKGAWWYNACLWSNLNGQYGNNFNYQGIAWSSLKTSYSFPRVEMKLRRA